MYDYINQKVKHKIPFFNVCTIYSNEEINKRMNKYNIYILLRVTYKKQLSVKPKKLLTKIYLEYC